MHFLHQVIKYKLILLIKNLYFLKYHQIDNGLLQKWKYMLIYIILMKLLNNKLDKQLLQQEYFYILHNGF